MYTDLIAKSIHDYYKDIYGEDWESLSETMKMSNRYQAYHTELVKLGFLGYIVNIGSNAK